MIDVARSSDPAILAILKSHPRVRRVENGPNVLDFKMGAWSRRVTVGDPSVESHGLVELMDNNPLVCADVVSVPTPASTLALIALGPLALAGLLAESPTMMVNVPADEGDLDAFLSTAGWRDGITLAVESTQLGGAVAATIIAAIRTPGSLDEIDDLYAERFGRSLYVRRDEDSKWDVDLVVGKPYALFRLRVSPDEPASLLTVQTMADGIGKCGAAQMVHAMNVMAGFEESLGLPPL